jgi:hypothetical protein
MKKLILGIVLITLVTVLFSLFAVNLANAQNLIYRDDVEVPEYLEYSTIYYGAIMEEQKWSYYKEEWRHVKDYDKPQAVKIIISNYVDGYYDQYSIEFKDTGIDLIYNIKELEEVGDKFIFHGEAYKRNGEEIEGNDTFIVLLKDLKSIRLIEGDDMYIFNIEDVEYYGDLSNKSEGKPTPANNKPRYNYKSL